MRQLLVVVWAISAGLLVQPAFAAVDLPLTMSLLREKSSQCSSIIPYDTFRTTRLQYRTAYRLMRPAKPYDLFPDEWVQRINGGNLYFPGWLENWQTLRDYRAYMSRLAFSTPPDPDLPPAWDTKIRAPYNAMMTQLYLPKYQEDMKNWSFHRDAAIKNIQNDPRLNEVERLNKLEWVELKFMPPAYPKLYLDDVLRDDFDYHQLCRCLHKGVNQAQPSPYHPPLAGFTPQMVLARCVLQQQ